MSADNMLSKNTDLLEFGEVKVQLAVIDALVVDQDLKITFH